MGMNLFSIYTDDEFRKIHLNPNLDLINEPSNNTDLILDSIQIEIDWTVLGGVSRVKNQGECNNCWVFSAIAAA